MSTKLTLEVGAKNPLTDGLNQYPPLDETLPRRTESIYMQTKGIQALKPGAHELVLDAYGNLIRLGSSTAMLAAGLADIFYNGNVITGVIETGLGANELYNQCGGGDYLKLQRLIDGINADADEFRPLEEGQQQSYSVIGEKLGQMQAHEKEPYNTALKSFEETKNSFRSFEQACQQCLQQNADEWAEEMPTLERMCCSAYIADESIKLCLAGKKQLDDFDKAMITLSEAFDKADPRKAAIGAIQEEMQAVKGRSDTITQYLNKMSEDIKAVKEDGFDFSDIFVAIGVSNALAPPWVDSILRQGLSVAGGVTAALGWHNRMIAVETTKKVYNHLLSIFQPVVEPEAPEEALWV